MRPQHKAGNGAPAARMMKNSSCSQLRWDEFADRIPSGSIPRNLAADTALVTGRFMVAPKPEEFFVLVMAASAFLEPLSAPGRA